MIKHVSGTYSIASKYSDKYCIEVNKQNQICFHGLSHVYLDTTYCATVYETDLSKFGFVKSNDKIGNYKVAKVKGVNFSVLMCRTFVRLLKLSRGLYIGKLEGDMLVFENKLYEKID